jgi:hypothetical protein
MAGLAVKLELKADLTGFARATHLRIAAGARIAAEKHAARAKLALRQDVRRAGLGDRLANTWRVEIYPKSASAHTHAPTVYVRSKAPLLVQAHEGMVIRAKNATWLAIPTDNVPRKGGRKRLTPVEVEARFDQDLILIHGLGRRMLAFIDKTLRGRLKRWRKRGTGDAPVARHDRLVLMFVMMPQVHLPRRLDWRRIFAELEAEWPSLFATEVALALNAGSN